MTPLKQLQPSFNRELHWRIITQLKRGTSYDSSTASDSISAFGIQVVAACRVWLRGPSWIRESLLAKAVANE